MIKRNFAVSLSIFFAPRQGPKSWRQSPLQDMKGSDKKKRVEDYEVSRASMVADETLTEATVWRRAGRRSLWSCK